MPWTPLHAALGETVAALDFGLIERACEERVQERPDLDWKQQLPLTSSNENREAKHHQQLELAKDIAAMANSGGGMIVYGVAETRQSGTSAADHIEAVGPIDEGTFRTIRQVAGNLVYPPVTGLQLLQLTSADHPDNAVLAMLVPDSLETPHLVHPSKGRDWFGAPYRHGSDTQWMVERQLASAYAARETGRRRRAADFDARFEALTSVLCEDSLVRWVVALAVPDRPLPRPRHLQLAEAAGIIDRAWELRRQSFGPGDLTVGEQTRRGLQRFFRTGRREITAARPAIARARVEVHGDGTVAVAFTRDGAIPGEGHQATQVPIDDIEATGLDFFALLWAVRTVLGISGDYTARLTMSPPTQIFRRPDPVLRGEYQRWDQQRVYGYLPVDGPVLTSEGLESALTSWVETVGDAVNQAGAPCTLDVARLLTAPWVES